MLDFWNKNLNPITMYPREIQKQATSGKQAKKDTIYVSSDLSLDSDYITAKEAIETLGIGAMKIKSHILAQGIEFKKFMSRDVTFYKRCDVEGIEIVVPSNFIIPEEFISSSELREHLGITTMALWTLANKKGWIKKKFKGNISYFLRSEVLKQC